MNSNELMYRNKYLKYKKKYSDLKNLDQKGGFFGIFKTDPVVEAQTKYNKEVRKYFEKTRDIFDKSSKLIATGNLSSKDATSVTARYQELTGSGYKTSVVSAGKIIDEILLIKDKFEKDVVTEGSKDIIISVTKTGEDYTESDYGADITKIISKLKKADESDITDDFNQESYNEWANTLIEKSISEMKTKLELDFPGAVEEVSYASLDNNISKINALRKQEIDDIACNKNNLPTGWNKCTPEKLKIIEKIKKSFEAIDSKTNELNKLSEKNKLALKALLLEVSQLEGITEPISVDNVGTAKIDEISSKIAEWVATSKSKILTDNGLEEADDFNLESIITKISELPREFGQSGGSESETELDLPENLSETPFN